MSVAQRSDLNCVDLVMGIVIRQQNSDVTQLNDVTHLKKHEGLLILARGKFDHDKDLMPAIEHMSAEKLIPNKGSCCTFCST